MAFVGCRDIYIYLIIYVFSLYRLIWDDLGIFLGNAGIVRGGPGTALRGGVGVGLESHDFP